MFSLKRTRLLRNTLQTILRSFNITHILELFAQENKTGEIRKDPGRQWKSVSEPRRCSKLASLGLNLLYVTILNMTLLNNDPLVIIYYNETFTQLPEHAAVLFWVYLLNKVEFTDACFLLDTQRPAEVYRRYNQSDQGSVLL